MHGIICLMQNLSAKGAKGGSIYRQSQRFQEGVMKPSGLEEWLGLRYERASVTSVNVG